MNYFFSMGRCTYLGAIYLPPTTKKADLLKRRPIYGRFLPRALLGAEYSDFGTLDLYVRSVVDVDSFKAAEDMKRRWNAISIFFLSLFNIHMPKMN